MSDFAYDPAYGATIQHEPRVLQAKFGDGYEQRVVDGINADLKQWSVVFTGTTAYVDAIDTALSGYAGATSFTWTPYGFSQIRVVCRKWTRTITDKGVASISAQFDQVTT